MNDDPKMKELYDRAELHAGVTEKLMSRVRQGEHIYMNRKTNILFLLKREFQRTNSCDYSLGELGYHLSYYFYEKFWNFVSKTVLKPMH